MSPTKAASKTPLSDLSPNTTSPTKSSTEGKVVENELVKMPATAAFPIHNDHTTNYVSPSDAVMSPTTKKLSEIKGRRFGATKTKQLNHRELFANARAQNNKKNSINNSKDLFASQSTPSSTQSTQTDDSS